jgi:fatty-acyl-CoA synthase
MTSTTTLPAQLAETLPGLLEAAAAAEPARVAVATLNRPPVSYAALAASARRIADGLARAGVGPGDRVAVLLPNRAEFLTLLLALARLDATAILLNTRLAPAEIGALLDRARPSAIATAWGGGFELPEKLAAILPESRAPLRLVLGVDEGGAREIAGLPVLSWRALDASPEHAGPPASPEAAALTFTTSGTTATPKLVLHRQEGLALHARDVARRLSLAPGAAAFVPVPLCGTFGLTLALAALAGGATLLLQERFDEVEADALMRAHAATHMVAPDAILARLIEAARGRPHTRRVFTGVAAFLPGAPQVIADAAVLGFAPRGVYGSSEMQALFAIQPEGVTTPGGVPGAGAAARLGEGGELELGGPSRFAQYLGDEAATQAALTADGFFRSGDSGDVTSDGFQFTTRLSDTLRLAGFRVAPEEIEAVLLRVPGVASALVVGARQGSVAIAFVQTQPDAALDEAILRAACAGSLAGYKIPERFVLRGALPHSEGANGAKASRAALRDEAEALLG